MKITTRVIARILENEVRDSKQSADALIRYIVRDDLAEDVAMELVKTYGTESERLDLVIFIRTVARYVERTYRNVPTRPGKYGAIQLTAPVGGPTSAAASHNLPTPPPADAISPQGDD